MHRFLPHENSLQTLVVEENPILRAGYDVMAGLGRDPLIVTVM